MVDLVFTGGVVFQFTAAALMAIFALLVAGLGKWRGGPLGFGIFALGFAMDGFGAALFDAQLAFVLAHGGDRWVPYLAGRMLALLGPLVSVAGVVMLTRTYGVRAWGRPWTWLFLGAMVLASLVMFIWDVTRFVDGGWAEEVRIQGLSYTVVETLTLTVGPILEPVMALGAVFLAKQYVRRPDRNVAILAVGMIAFPAVKVMFIWGLILSWVLADGSDFLPYVVASFDDVTYSLIQMAPIFAWVWANHRTGRRAALVVAGVGGAFALIGLVNYVYVDFGAPGLARIFDIGLVGYAILRYQYLGLDIKLRWTLSKSTVAAVFVAAFFVASEAAQEFFGDQLNDKYIGIAAAGLLVFAIAPLQRLGDRLATKAVPITTEAATTAYRHAVMAALRDDGKIGPREELHLAELAQRLEIGAADALRIRHDAASTLA